MNEGCCTTRHSGTHDEYNARRRAYEAEYRASHRDANAAKLGRWRASENGINWRLNYLARSRENRRSWYRRHGDEARVKSLVKEARRRAVKVAAAGYATYEDVLARVAFYGEKCWMCQAPYGAIDHVVPLSRGGSNWPANLRPACRSCNSRKGAKLVQEMT